ncbi:zinc finger MYM-type protein 1-like [Aphis craccivora]|uniref:Zinc finger MYM-type protein 1-like n=1 Tax=Aphis craccivora TaxID=307492 RepID=A0A6G0Y0K9_APHCR|nr:zinc finger MYM-type protein 1-like [Aphis craccivora]
MYCVIYLVQKIFYLKLLIFLKKIRCDESFNKCLKDAETIALDLDVEDSFTFFSYEQPDESIVNLKTKFKVEFYFYTLGVTLNSLEERFVKLHITTVLILNFRMITLGKLYGSSIATIRNENVGNSDIDAIEMTDELVAISDLLKPNSTPLEMSQFIVNNNNFIPNVAVALRIILTMPVFYMNQERLCDLATTSIEKEVIMEL